MNLFHTRTLYSVQRTLRRACTNTRYKYVCHIAACGMRMHIGNGVYMLEQQPDAFDTFWSIKWVSLPLSFRFLLCVSYDSSCASNLRAIWQRNSTGTRAPKVNVATPYAFCMYLPYVSTITLAIIYFFGNSLACWMERIGLFILGSCVLILIP